MFSGKDWFPGYAFLLPVSSALIGVMVCVTVARPDDQQLVVSAGARGAQAVPLGAVLAAAVIGVLADEQTR